MALSRIAYVFAVLFAGFGCAAIAILLPDTQIAVTLGAISLALLTFPMGFLASVIAFVLIFSGFATPEEAIVVSTPVHALLGYIQWFRLLPAIYRRTP